MLYLSYPTKYISITQYYKSKHRAIDIANSVKVNGIHKDNTNVYMIYDGIVTQNAYSKTYGYFVEYKIKDENNTYIVRDGHFDTKSDLVVGEKYPKGTFINKMGNSGTSRGKHDHHILELNGVRVDPMKYEYKYPEQIIGDLETHEILIYNEETPDVEVVDQKFELGDKVNCKGYATEKPDGTGNRTLVQDGELRYITSYKYGAIRPYHISKGANLGEGDRGWCLESDLSKLD